MYRHILVAVDGSGTASRGLCEAISLAKHLGSRLRLLHVVNQTPWAEPSFMPAAAASFV